MESTERVNTSLTCTWWAATNRQKEATEKSPAAAMANLLPPASSKQGKQELEVRWQRRMTEELERQRETGEVRKTQECQQIHKQFWLPRMGSGGVFSGSVTGWYNLWK
jgi:hypothetical protein